MSSYDRESVLVRLKHAEGRVIALEGQVKALTMREERERRTKEAHERRANRLIGHLMYVHDHCGREEWKERIMSWIKAL